MPKQAKKEPPPPTPPDPPASMGISPAVLAKRDIVKRMWCPTVDIESDPNCDPENPKMITFPKILRAASLIRPVFPRTPITKAHCSKKLGLHLHFKVETLHRTGSFLERGAYYALKRLTTEQKYAGVITASLGNFALALAYHAKSMGVKTTVVLPASTLPNTVHKCEDFGATVYLRGANLGESKRYAFVMLKDMEKPPIYINGYDHPNVIAAAGTIGLEIMEQLPDTEVIIVPVGGGGLLAGIAVTAKQIKHDVHIYGVEPKHSCGFFKAMDRQLIYTTSVVPGLANSLAVPTPGCNAFYTAKSFIDKMVLVEDDWIAQGIMHLAEEEKLIAEGAGAISMAPLLAVPDILPELQGKTVVCVISGSNIDAVTVPRCIERAKAVEGRLIKLTVTLPADQLKVQLKVLSMIANVGANVIFFDTDHNWVDYDDLYTVRLNLVIETRNIEHACTLKRVMLKLFPSICEFLEDPFSPMPICFCFPKKRHY